MSKTRDQLDADLAVLDEAMPRLRAECGEAEFWLALACLAGDITTGIGSAGDVLHVNNQLDEMLVRHRLEEGLSCSSGWRQLH